MTAYAVLKVLIERKYDIMKYDVSDMIVARVMNASLNLLLNMY